MDYAAEFHWECYGDIRGVPIQTDAQNAHELLDYESGHSRLAGIHLFSCKTPLWGKQQRGIHKTATLNGEIRLIEKVRGKALRKFLHSYTILQSS